MWGWGDRISEALDGAGRLCVPSGLCRARDGCVSSLYLTAVANVFPKVI